MGKKSSSSKTKKNKGPKGKRARAKAKLQRQWGEEATEETVLRKGKSRLLSSSSTLEKDASLSAPAKDSVSRTNEALSSSAHDSEDESDDENDDDGEAVSMFLASIKEQHTDDMEHDVPDDDDAHEGTMNDDIDDIDDEENIQDSFTGDTVDIYGERFTRQPLSEPLAKAIAGIQATQKVNLPYFRHAELEISKGFIERWKLNANEQSEWRRQALQAFRCNREFLQRNWTSSNGQRIVDANQSVLYPLLANYLDLLFTGENRQNRKSFLRGLALHVANHVITSRQRIRRHSRRIQEIREEEGEDALGDALDSEAWRDQGFVRPTVLVLLPTRSVCRTFVHLLNEMVTGKTAVGDKADAAGMVQGERFEQDFGVDSTEDQEQDETDADRRRKLLLASKGPEWLELFGDEVNVDDDFKLGLNFVLQKSKSKTGENDEVKSNCSLKLYSGFYQSDVILASPLGLTMSCTQEDGTTKSDFLSSIEICALVRADVMLMQNWDHVNSVLQMVNQLPQGNTNEVDFSRVRQYHLTGQGAHWRQLIVSSKLLDPQMISTFKRFAKSVNGLARFRTRVPDVQDSILAQVLTPVRQVFERVPCNNVAQQSADRLKHFSDKIMPKIKGQPYTMIFLPSYFDFVAVRNLLLKREYEFVSVTEYSRVSEVSRGRARFYQGRKPLMLYTGRAYYFQRHKIKGVRHLIFYGLPEHAEFYEHHVNFLGEGGSAVASGSASESESCLALFSKYDSHALERIVGRANCQLMVKGERSTFTFQS